MGKGLAIAGFILSLIGLVAGFIFFYFSLPCSIIGLVLSVIGGKRLKANNLPHGLATAGLVIGIISICLSVLMTACGIVALVAVGELSEEVAGSVTIQ